MVATSGVRGVPEGRKGGIEDLKKDEKDTNAPQQSPVHRLVLGEVGEGGEGFGAFTGSGRFDAIVCWCKEYSVVILVDLSWKKVRWR